MIERTFAVVTVRGHDEQLLTYRGQGGQMPMLTVDADEATRMLSIAQRDNPDAYIVICDRARTVNGETTR